MKDKAIEGAMNSIENRIRHVYNQGLEDGKESVQIDESTAYKAGLEAAWECARKMVLSDEDGGIALSDILKIFGMTQYSAIKRFSASEAIAKLKEYEEKQKRTCDTCQYGGHTLSDIRHCVYCDGFYYWTPKQAEDAEIKVGDEVIYHDGGAHDGSVGVVVGVEKDWREVKFKCSWSCVGVHKDSLTRTGRNFPQIEEVLEQLKGEE